jgi:hypothetical protein
MMREFELRAASTYFANNRKYNTWLGLPNANTKKRKAYQIDHIFIPKLQLCQTMSVKRRFDGATSDHAAVCIDFYFLTAPLLKKKRDLEIKPPRKKLDNVSLITTKHSNFQEKVNEFFQKLTPKLAIFSSPSVLLDEFEKHIIKNALEVAPKEERNRPDWFTEDEENLIDLIEARNLAYKKFMKHPNDGNQQKLKDSRRNLLRSKRKAKRQWQFEFAQECQKQSFKLNPKKAWKLVFKLMEGFQSHHRAYIPKKFKNKSGIGAKDDEGNAKILNTHFYSLFNSKVQVDELF